MVRDVHARFYDKASRYTTSAFMRLKLGGELRRREMRRTSSRPPAGPPPNDAAGRGLSEDPNKHLEQIP